MHARMGPACIADRPRARMHAPTTRHAGLPGCRRRERARGAEARQGARPGELLAAWGGRVCFRGSVCPSDVGGSRGLARALWRLATNPLPQAATTTRNRPRNSINKNCTDPPGRRRDGPDGAPHQRLRQQGRARLHSRVHGVLRGGARAGGRQPHAGAVAGASSALHALLRRAPLCVHVGCVAPPPPESPALAPLASRHL
jgi:hypothetical protein